GGLVKTRTPTGDVFGSAAHGAIVIGGGAAPGIVDAGRLVHLFGDSIWVDGVVGDGEHPDRVLLNSVHDTIVTGFVHSFGALDVNAGVSASATVAQLTGTISLTSLGAGNVYVYGAGGLDAEGALSVNAGRDVNLQADA